MNVNKMNKMNKNAARLAANGINEKTTNVVKQNNSIQLAYMKNNYLRNTCFLAVTRSMVYGSPGA